MFMPKKLSIIHAPNSILRQEAQPVPLEQITSKKITQLITDMKKTLEVTPDGVGLAAPQVNESLQIFIVSEEALEIDLVELRKKKERNPNLNAEPYQKRDWRYYVFINPIVKKSAKRELLGAEGCLSVPGKFGHVSRQEKIIIEAYDEHGKKFTRGASRFFARVLQHELDHLKGKLFIDTAEELFDADKTRKL